MRDVGIDPGRPIVVLTGAGVSVESGLPTYRGPDGLWEGWRLEEVATPEAFARRPDLVRRFYDERRAALLAADIMPNAAHHALAELERRWPGGFLLVTQNVDDLHERAGGRDVIHMHGELLKVRCLACGVVAPWREAATGSTVCPACDVPGRLRPHVVWFGEVPLGLERIEAALRACGLFLAIGTSGRVYPAAGFVAEVRRGGRAHTVELNTEASAGSALFAERRPGPAATTVPAYVAELLARAV